MVLGGGGVTFNNQHRIGVECVDGELFIPFRLAGDHHARGRRIFTHFAVCGIQQSLGSDECHQRRTKYTQELVNRQSAGISPDGAQSPTPRLSGPVGLAHSTERE
jgi:hypothetical protein